MELFNNLDAAIVSLDKGVISIRSGDGVKLFETVSKNEGSWTKSIKRMELLEKSSAQPVFAFMMISRRLWNSKTIEVSQCKSRIIGYTGLIGFALMKKRVFVQTNEIRGPDGKKIASFQCDGVKYVFEPNIGTGDHNKSNKNISFTIRFIPSLESSVKLLMVASALLMIENEKEAQDNLSMQVQKY